MKCSENVAARADEVGQPESLVSNAVNNHTGKVA